MIAVRAGSVSSSAGQSTTSAIAHHVLGVEESAAGSACTWGRSWHITWRPWKLMFGVAHEGLVDENTPMRSPRHVSMRTASFRKSVCSGFLPSIETGRG